MDILFQENSTIGQKIKLSETIVMALRKMHVRSQEALWLTMMMVQEVPMLFVAMIIIGSIWCLLLVGL